MMLSNAKLILWVCLGYIRLGILNSDLKKRYTFDNWLEIIIFYATLRLCQKLELAFCEICRGVQPPSG